MRSAYAELLLVLVRHGHTYTPIRFLIAFQVTLFQPYPQPPPRKAPSTHLKSQKANPSGLLCCIIHLILDSKIDRCVFEETRFLLLSTTKNNKTPR
jgi:hypothetical protein